MKYIRFWQGCLTTMARASVVSCPNRYITTHPDTKEILRSKLGQVWTWEQAAQSSTPSSLLSILLSSSLPSPAQSKESLFLSLLLSFVLLLSYSLSITFSFSFLVRNRFSPPLCSSASADWRLWTLLAVRRPAFTCKQKRSNEKSSRRRNGTPSF